MVNRLPTNRRTRRESGALITEIVIAMAILVAAMMPLAYSYMDEQRMVRNLYQKSVAMEIIDGEMEILVAGEWRSFKEGTQPYPIETKTSKNLPHGTTTLTIEGKHLRLEWKPEKAVQGRAIVREATVK